MPIDSDFYKIHTHGGAFADELLISAHGGYSARTDYFTTPVVLNFYAPDGYVLDDPGARNLMIGGGCPAFETTPVGGQCRNYELSKYQGKHNKTGETYASLAADMAMSRNHRNMVLGLTAQEKKVLGANADLSYSPEMDVLTVRNRLGKKGTPNLAEAVTWALSLHQYKSIHCSFCRVAAHHPGKDAYWNVKRGAHSWA